MIIKIHNHCQFEPSNSLSFQGFCKWCGKEQLEHSTTMSNNKQSSIEGLYSNNETICEMLLLDKIPKSTYEQLINCFSMNLEQAKAMHKEEHRKTFNQGLISNFQNFEDYYNETFNTEEK